MLVRRSKTELDHDEAERRRREIHLGGMNELGFKAASCEPQDGAIAMALEAGGIKYCRFTHTENGKVLSRRIHTMTVQAADGRMHQLEGDALPDELQTWAGAAYKGAHMATVLLEPKKAKASVIPPAADGWITKRDAFFVMLGFFFLRLITFLAEEVALALT